MNNYWANFETQDNYIFRTDTRIYLEPIESVHEDDMCVGAIVGKNPGSAKPSGVNNGMQEIKRDGDKLLPTVLNIVRKSYEMRGMATPNRGFVQVLNLFYLCNPTLEKAILQINKLEQDVLCSSENNSFPWVWYVWGGPSRDLNKFKDRFSSLKSCKHFYFDKKNVIESIPERMSFAKHTQGLKHDDIVPFISQIIS